MAQKKYSYSAKKVRVGFRGFRTCFWEVDHPICDVWKQKKTQILIEFLDGTKKVQLFGKKSSARV